MILDQPTADPDLARLDCKDDGGTDLGYPQHTVVGQPVLTVYYMTSQRGLKKSGAVG